MKVRTMLYGHADPYAGPPPDPAALDLQGWNSTHPIFQRLIAETGAKRICEVGSWKGASACEMARHIEPASLDRIEMVCVDTWLGSLEMWADPEKYTLLALAGARPRIWDIFRNNIMVRGLCDIVTPFPATSQCAAQFFRRKKVEQFDLVYIDASHEFADVLADIEAYSPLSRVVFGDDFDWPGVREAVERVALTTRRIIETDGEKWILR